jgi:hypothetical protein
VRILLNGAQLELGLFSVSGAVVTYGGAFATGDVIMAQWATQPKSLIKELAMKRLLLITLVSLCLPAIAQTHRYQVGAIAAMQSGLAAPAPTTWYVRKDGGTRKTCDGKADSAPVGTKSNQHCALGDYRFLYDDQSGKPLKWVMAGGDKVILKDGPWRVGFNQGASSNDVWGRAGLGPQASEAPPIPAGTAAQHTQILGENFASCSAANKTQLFCRCGVHRAYPPLAVHPAWRPSCARQLQP